MSEAAKPAVGAKVAAKKKKIRKGVTRGIAHIKATFNNTIVTITDTAGETISWASAGKGGYFKGARKSTPYAAGRAAENAAQQARKVGMVEVEVKVKGPGAGRDNRAAPGAGQPQVRGGAPGVGAKGSRRREGG